MSINILDSDGVPFKQKSFSNYNYDFNFAGSINIGGVDVNARSAFQHSIVYSCIRVLAESIGQLPVRLYKIDDKGNRERVYKHDQLKVLTKQPNDYMTWQEMLELIVTHLNLNGNFFAYVNKRKTKNSFKILEIIPIPNPSAVTIKMLRGRVTYEINEDSIINLPKRVFTSDEILHIKGPSIDGLKGVSPITQAARTIGLSMAAEKHGEEFFNNSATPNGILTSDQALSDAAMKRLQAGWNEVHQGIKNSNKLAVLEEGLKYQNITVSNKDSQFMETRMFQKNEICAIFRVPTQMVQAGDSKYSNYEQAILSFHRDTLVPLINRIVQRLNIMIDSEYELDLDDSHIIRGDSKTQADVADIYFKMGTYTINEIRALRGDSMIEGGDVVAVATNNMTLGNLKDIEKLQAEAIAEAQKPKEPNPIPTQEAENNESAQSDEDK
jgi:HK97 family phage portal protein